jgi:membrane-associated HD superfamily phosphohydrolase
MFCDEISTTQHDVLDDFDISRQEIVQISKFCESVNELKQMSAGHNAEKTKAYHFALKEVLRDDICIYYMKRYKELIKMRTGREKILHELRHHLKIDRRKMTKNWRIFLNTVDSILQGSI